MPPQLRTLDEINIPEFLQFTNNNNPFLIKDIVIDNDKKTLLFIIKANICHLSQALFWIMNGTFKTMPTVFHQLYIIHVPISAKNNSKILSLMYTLMTSKSEEIYRQFSAPNFRFGLVFGSDLAFSSKILPKTFFGLKFLLKNVFGPNF